MHSESQLSFASILASSVHDMKNSVGMLMLSLHQILEEISPQNAEQQARFSQLEYEAARINNDLIQLLTLYRLDEKILAASIDEVVVKDLLIDQLARNDILLSSKSIRVECHCDPSLVWYLDAELIGSVINNLLVNAARYARKQISISAYPEDQFLKIQINDDGEGFPLNMLGATAETESHVASHPIGATQLGLLFARRILALHSANQRQGYLHLCNQGIDSGGKVALYIP